MFIVTLTNKKTGAIQESHTYDSERKAKSAYGFYAMQADLKRFKLTIGAVQA